MLPNYNILRETYLALLNEACFAEMIEMCNRIYQEADATGDDATTAVALLGMSNACFARGESYKSETYARRALYFAEESRDDRVICDALIELGGVEIIINGQHDIARERLHRALTIARLIEYREGQAGALRGIGVSYLQQRQMELSLSHLNQSVSIAYQTTNRRLQALTSNSLGSWYINNNQLHKAADYFRQAVEQCQYTGDRINEATILCSLGLVYMQSPNSHTLAFDYLERSLKLARELRFPYAEICTLDAMGLAHARRHQIEQALDKFREAYALARLNENDALFIVALEHLAEAYQLLGDHERAIKSYKELVEKLRHVGNYEQVMEKTMKIALLYRDIGQLDQTAVYYKEALEIRRTYHLKDQTLPVPLQMMLLTLSDLPRLLWRKK